MPKQLYQISHPQLHNYSQTYFYDSKLDIYYKTVQKNSTPTNPNVIFPHLYPNIKITKF